MQAKQDLRSSTVLYSQHFGESFIQALEMNTNMTVYIYVIVGLIHFIGQHRCTKSYLNNFFKLKFFLRFNHSKNICSLQCAEVQRIVSYKCVFVTVKDDNIVSF